MENVPSAEGEQIIVAVEDDGMGVETAESGSVRRRVKMAPTNGKGMERVKSDRVEGRNISGFVKWFGY